MKVENLNSCIRSELAAIETYRQALEKHREQYGRQPAFGQLSEMLSDHEQAAARWRAIVEQNGGTPTTDSGAWGTWSKTVMGTAKLFGDKAALKALKEGEESGLKEYRNVEQDGSAPAEARRLAAELASRREGHIRTLDRLVEAA